MAGARRHPEPEQQNAHHGCSAHRYWLQARLQTASLLVCSLAALSAGQEAVTLVGAAAVAAPLDDVAAIGSRPTGHIGAFAAIHVDDGVFAVAASRTAKRCAPETLSPHWRMSAPSAVEPLAVHRPAAVDVGEAEPAAAHVRH